MLANVSLLMGCSSKAGFSLEHASPGITPVHTNHEMFEHGRLWSRLATSLFPSTSLGRARNDGAATSSPSPPPPHSPLCINHIGRD